MHNELNSQLMDIDRFTMQAYNDLLTHHEGLQQLVEKQEQLPQLVRDVWCMLYTGKTEFETTSPLQILSELEEFPLFLQQAIGDKLITTLATLRFGYLFLRQLEQPEDKSLEEAFKKEIQHVLEQVEYVEDLLSSLQQRKQERQQTPIYDQLALADALEKQSELQQMAEWAKKFKISAKQKRVQTKTASILKGTVTTGQKAERLLPIEYLKSETHEAELDFLVRFSEGRTRMYDYKERTKKEKGALIICYDESSSMQDLDVQGKGFLMALLSMAKQDRRDFVFIPFSGDVDYQQIQHFKKGKYKIPQFLQFAQSYIGGGTNFEKPLQQAVQFMKHSTKGEVLFITDGVCHIPETVIEQMNAEKTKKQFYLMSLLIGHNKHPGQLAEISDEVLHLIHFQDIHHTRVFEL